MWRMRAAALAAAVSLGVAAMPDGAVAKFGGGGGNGGGGGRSWGGGGFSRGGGGSFSRSVNPGYSGNRNVFTPSFSGNRSFVKPGLKGNQSVSGNLADRHVLNGGRSAWIGGHRVHGRRIHGFIPGYGYGYYWYYDDCYVWTDYGWINMCGYGFPFVY
jgi:hypothetical protein